MRNFKEFRKSSISIYTIIFVFCSLLFSFYFSIHNKSFIWKHDGIFQHYSILYDFNEIFREFFKNPLEGINQWSFNIGYGADIIGTYSYYVLGDPFAYLSLLFPMDKLELAFNILIILRLYCAGLAFILYAKKMKFSNKAAILGGISYSFSSFIILEAIRHPYFINPLILIPLAFMCIENVLRNEKKYTFSILVACAMILNFYFFYMIAILSIIYAFIRFIDFNKNNSIKFIFYFKNLFIYFTIGILMSSFILLPTIYFISSSSRSGNNLSEIFRFLYEPGYYSNLIFTSISPGKSPSWTVVTAPIIVYMFLPLFIRIREKYKTYFYMYIIFLIMILFPIFGLIMNGFSSISNRWTLIFAFMSSLIICIGFDNISILNKKDIKNSIFILIFYCFIALIAKILPNIKGIFIPIIILGFLTIMLFNIYLKNNNKKIFFSSLLIILILNIGINCLYRYSGKGLKYINEFCKSETSKEFYDNAFNGEEEYIKKIDKSFYRISKAKGVSRNKTRNNSIVKNYNGIDSYLSVTNGSMAELSKELGNRSYTANSPIINFDNRPIITDVLGVKYVISKNSVKNKFESSLKKINDNGKFSTYENKNVLPFGYVYSNIMSKDNFDKLNPAMKEEALIYNAIIDNSSSFNSKINESEIKSKVENIGFTFKKNSHLVNKNKFIIDKNNTKIKIRLDEIKKGNLYFRIKNLRFTPIPYDEVLNKKIKSLGEDKSYIDVLKIKGKKLSKFETGKDFKIVVRYGKIKKAYSQTDITDASSYRRMDDILFNLGYFKGNEKNKTIKIKFNKAGIYTFDSIDVYNLPIDKYNNDLNNLKENRMNIEYINDDKVIGNINTNKSGILMFQIPYTKGWTVKIDGKEEENFPVNIGFLGANIEKGNHEIELDYNTPYLKLGIYISLIGVGLLLFSIRFDKKYKKDK